MKDIDINKIFGDNININDSVPEISIPMDKKYDKYIVMLATKVDDISICTQWVVEDTIYPRGLPF